MSDPGPPSRLDLRLEADAGAPGRARRGLGTLGLRPESRADVAIVLSELVTNSVRHGRGGQIVVRAEVGAVVRVEVVDDGPCFERRPAPMPLHGGGGGRGLPLVEALALRWGVEPRDGCTVWAELPR